MSRCHRKPPENEYEGRTSVFLPSLYLLYRHLCGSQRPPLNAWVSDSSIPGSRLDPDGIIFSSQISFLTGVSCMSLCRPSHFWTAPSLHLDGLMAVVWCLCLFYFLRQERSSAFSLGI